MLSGGCRGSGFRAGSKIAEVQVQVQVQGQVQELLQVQELSGELQLQGLVQEFSRESPAMLQVLVEGKQTVLV